jgi:hypothetical protein
MNGLPAHPACISYRNGATWLSADTPYDRELLFEQVHLDVERYGAVRLQLDHHGYVVSALPARARARCKGCGRRLTGLAYMTGQLRLCERCVRNG